MLAFTNGVRTIGTKSSQNRHSRDWRLQADECSQGVRNNAIHRGISYNANNSGQRLVLQVATRNGSEIPTRPATQWGTCMAIVTACVIIERHVEQKRINSSQHSSGARAGKQTTKQPNRSKGMQDSQDGGRQHDVVAEQKFLELLASAAGEVLLQRLLILPHRVPAQRCKTLSHCYTGLQDALRQHCPGGKPSLKACRKTRYLHACTALRRKGCARVECDVILQPRDDDSAKEHLMARAY